MRPVVARKVAAATKNHYARILQRIPRKREVVNRFRDVFGPQVQRLPRSLCLELVVPELRAAPTRRDFFANLDILGHQSLQLYLNAFLGTQNVQLPESVVARFAAEHHLEGLLVTRDLQKQHTQITGFPESNESPNSKISSGYSLVTSTMGCVEAVLGPQAAIQMTKDSILGGRRGLANIYLESIL